MKNKIINILKDINPYETITETTDLIDDEVLDSVSIMLLITNLESEFNISVNFNDIVLDNFRNVDSIVDLVEKSKKVD